MNKRGDVFQQQFNRAAFASAGTDLLPSLAKPKHFHEDHDEEDKILDAKPQPRIPSFKYSDEHDSNKTGEY